MAKIVHKTSGSITYLLPHHTFGRQVEAVNTGVSFPEISMLHTVIKWNGSGWYIEDVSTNGTLLDGKPLTKGLLKPLREGQTFVLAGLEEGGWEVLDLSPPEQQLISLKDPTRVLALDVYNLLPSEETPEVAIYKDLVADVYRCQKLSEGISSEAKTLKHGDNVLIAHELWQCFLPVAEAQTVLVKKAAVHLRDLLLTINLSQDEESVSVGVQSVGINTDFGVKAHHYLVCHLARKKLEDAAACIDDTEQGWIDNSILCSELGMEETHLNVQIYRIRHQVNKALTSVVDVESFVERRSGAIRLGLDSSNLYVSKVSNPSLS